MQGRGWALLQAVQKKHPMKCAGVVGRRVRTLKEGLPGQTADRYARQMVH